MNPIVALDRRDFLKGTLLTAAALSANAGRAAAAASASQAEPIECIDTNVTLFQWPFRRLPQDQTDLLLEKMRRHAITQAWAGSFEGILHRDIASVNRRLTQECARTNGRLVPFGSVNPTLPNWEEDVRRCHEIHRMPGIRLHPNYHGYTLSDPRCKRLLEIAAERALLVQIPVLMEDTRTQHPMMVARDVDPAPLLELLPAIPRARVVLLNCGKVVDGPLFDRLSKRPNIYFDTARVEYTGGVGRLLRRAPVGRVLFGSHAPLFIYETAIIRLVESSLTEDETRALMQNNPRKVLNANLR